MVKLKYAIPALIVGLAGAGVSHAQSLGLNFAADDPNAAASALGATDVAGVVAQSNWNNLDGASGTDATGFVLSDGSASTALVTWSSPNSWRAGANTALTGGDGILTNGYLDTGNTAENGISIAVSGLDPALTSMSYDVYVYFVSDSTADRGGAYTIDDGSGPIVQYGSTLAAPSAHVLDPGTDADNSADGTYLRFSGLTGGSFTLTSDTTLTTPNGFRAPINGIQVVAAPEPSSIALSLLGGAGLMALIRRRNKKS